MPSAASSDHRAPGRQPGQVLASHAWFTRSCGMRASAYVRPGSHAAGEDIARLRMAFVPEKAGGGYGSFKDESDSMEVPPADLAMILSVLRGARAHHEARIAQPGQSPKSLQLQRQDSPSVERALYLGFSGPRVRCGGPMTVHDVYRVEMVIAHVLRAENPDLPIEMMLTELARCAVLPDR